MFLRVFSVLLFGLAFHFAYQDYIFPTYSYANFRNYDQTPSDLFLTYILLALPAPIFALSRRKTTGSTFGVALLYVILYIPGQIMLPRMLDSVYFPVLLMQLALVASMVVLAIVSRVGVVDIDKPKSIPQPMSFLLLILTISSLLAFIATNYQHMRFVGFADIYELRAESSDTVSIPILAYTNLWLGYCFLPFYLAKGIYYRELFPFLLGLAGCIAIYLATGSKAQILLPVIMLGIYLFTNRTKALVTMLALVNAALVFLVTILPDLDIFSWLKFSYLMRTLGIGGFSMPIYYEFFSTFGYTRYSHINGLGLIVGPSPYGGLSMGQVVGLHYFGSIEANYNANFWASDGFGALGIAGIPVVTAVFSVFIYTLNRLSSYYDQRFISLWMTGFWLALLNLPLSTALLSGGGIITLLILFVVRLQSVAAQSRFGDTRLSQIVKTN